jgi:hypothetical protein
MTPCKIFAFNLNIVFVRVYAFRVNEYQMKRCVFAATDNLIIIITTTTKLPY